MAVFSSQNAVNLIRHSFDKFKKFGAEVHSCGIARAKTSALRSSLTHPVYEEVTR